MKKTLFLVALLHCFINYAQSQKDSLNAIVKKRVHDINRDLADNPYYSKQEIEDEYINENEIFQSLSQPDENSDLSNYFKIYLDNSLLKDIDFGKLKSSYYYRNISNKNYNYTIRLTFEINKKNKAFNFRINTGSKDLDKEVIAVFKKYPLEKLSLGENAKLGKISIQLFARENKKTIVKASKFAVIDQVPTLKDCENTKYDSDLTRCMYDQIFQYILDNISVSTIAKQKLKGEVQIYPRFSVDADGNIFRVNSLAPNKIIKDEIDRLIQSYDKKIIPAKRNDKATNYFCSTSRMLVIVEIK